MQQPLQPPAIAARLPSPRDVEEFLEKEIIGQDHAIRAIFRHLVLFFSGFKGLLDRGGKRPVGVFLFLGPSGTGKTEIGKKLAQALYGTDNAYIFIPMGEGFQQPHDVSKFIGSPPGYIGYDDPPLFSKENLWAKIPVFKDKVKSRKTVRPPREDLALKDFLEFITDQNESSASKIKDELELIEKETAFFLQEHSKYQQKKTELLETLKEKEDKRLKDKLRILEEQLIQIEANLDLLHVRKVQIILDQLEIHFNEAQDFYDRRHHRNQELDENETVSSSPSLRLSKKTKRIPVNTAPPPPEEEPLLIIILDELEKAHPAIFKFLLNVFEEGRVFLSTGEEVSFENAMIIMASNAGEKIISDILKKRESWLGLAPRAKKNNGENLEKKVKEEIKTVFPLTFINRMDEIVVFKDLSDEDLVKIIELRLTEMNRNLGRYFHTLEVGPTVKEHILSKVKEVPEKQARQVDQVLKDLIIMPLSDLHEQSPLGQNKLILIQMERGEIKIKVTPKKLPNK